LSEDFSNGYEAIADEFLAIRTTSGQALVQKWASSFSRHTSVIDIGAGSGEPLTSVLLEAGLVVSAIDASPKMVAVFKQRFPRVEVACEPVEHSVFFNRKFDAALAIGLIFLLPEASQCELIRKVADALKPGGRFLFSAPRQPCKWNDILTGQPSLSLGVDKYSQILASASLNLIDEHVDAGETYYYEAQKLKSNCLTAPS